MNWNGRNINKRLKNMIDFFEKKFDKAISDLSDKEQVFFRKLKYFVMNSYNSLIKPILIAMFLFWTFGKVKAIVGLEETIYIQLVVIIIFLRIIANRLS